ncbi:MAG: ATP-binding protein [Candidatus Omnitrophota bacterium]
MIPQVFLLILILIIIILFAPSSLLFSELSSQSSPRSTPASDKETVLNFLALGQQYREKGQYAEALKILNRAASLVGRLKTNTLKRDTYLEMSKTYEALKQYDQSLTFYKEYKAIDDLILKKTSQQKIDEFQKSYLLDNKEKEIALLKNDEEIRQLTLGRQRIFITSVILISFFILLVIIVIHARYRLKTRANHLLQEEIREHKQTALKLQENEEQFRTLTEQAVVGICITRDDMIQYVNPRLLTMFGYTESEIIGGNALRLAAESERPAIEKFLDPGLIKDGEATAYEFQGITKEGQIIHLESYSTRIIFQGQPAVLKTIIDVTERKRLETELNKNQQLESVGVLVDGIAIDFDKLLAVITRNLSAILGHTDTSAEAAKFLKPAAKASRQASDLVEKLITFSRGGWFRPQKIKFSTLLNDTLNSYPQINHDIVIAPGLKPIYGDERQLRRVLHSILLNADESMTDPKHVKIEATDITLKCDNPFGLKPGDYIKISITDNGKGIPPDRLEKIFEPYFTTKSTFNQKGMGLGLAICYSILKKHNGHITISSQPGKGATVEMYLPVLI